jgi:hypothetical protein
MTLCADLNTAHRGYCQANGQKDKDIWSPGRFFKQLGEMGFGKTKINGQRYRTGIGLKPEAVPGLHKTPWTATGPTVSTAALPDIDELASKL